MEGIYRLSGQHSKVTQLLKSMMEGIVANFLLTLDWRLPEILAGKCQM